MWEGQKAKVLILSILLVKLGNPIKTIQNDLRTSTGKMMCVGQLASLDEGKSVIASWLARRQICFRLAEGRRELRALEKAENFLSKSRPIELSRRVLLCGCHRTSPRTTETYFVKCREN